MLQLLPNTATNVSSAMCCVHLLRRYKELAKEKAQALPADQPAAAEATPGTAASGRTDAGSSEPSQAAAGCAGAEGVGAANLEEAQEADEAADGPADGAAEDALKATAAPQHFPISVVRKIMSLDEDVQRISSGAARATSRAAELFIQVRPSCRCRSITDEN